MLGRDHRKQPDWFAGYTEFPPTTDLQNIMRCSPVSCGLVALLTDRSICLRSIVRPVLLDLARTVQEKAQSIQDALVQADLMWCGRIFMLSVNVRQVRI